MTLKKTVTAAGGKTGEIKEPIQVCIQVPSYV